MNPAPLEGFNHRLFPESPNGKVTLFVLLLVALLKGWVLIGIIPLWQGPDESTHFAYIQFIAEEKEIPVGKPSSGEYRTDFSKELIKSREALDYDHVAFNSIKIQRFLLTGQPDFPTESAPEDRRVDPLNYHNSALGYSPVYYLYGSFFYWLFNSQPIENRAYAVRLGTSLLIVPFLLFAFGFARNLLGRETPSLALTAFVSFQPMVSMMFSIVNNDALLITASAGAFYGMTSYLGRRDIRTLLLTGLWTGLACLAKTQGLFLLVPWFATLAGASVLTRKILPRHGVPVRYFGIGVLPILVLLIPWWMFCQIHYGSWLGPSFAPLETVEAKYVAPDLLHRLLPLFFKWPYTVFVSFWGNFGHLDTPIHESVASVLWWGWLALVGIALLALGKLAKNGFRPRELFFLFALLGISVLALDYILGFFFYPSMMYEGGQGRYYFSIWLPLAGMGFYSLRILFAERTGHALMWGLTSSIVVYYLYSVFAVLIPRYYL